MNTSNTVKRRTSSGQNPNLRVRLWRLSPVKAAVLPALCVLLLVLLFASGGPSRSASFSSGRLSPLEHYLRSGYLVADGRTLIAMVRYIVQPEAATPVSNDSGWSAPPALFVNVRTNRPAV